MFDNNYHGCSSHKSGYTTRGTENIVGDSGNLSSPTPTMEEGTCREKNGGALGLTAVALTILSAVVFSFLISIFLLQCLGLW